MTAPRITMPDGKPEPGARNLAKVKGRHNSEIAMNQLLETLK